MADQSARVDTRIAAYEAMEKRWRLPRALRGGTLAMREGAQEWLPQEEGEQTTKYATRLGRSVLYGAYDDTIAKLSGKPFARAVSITTDSLPGPLRALEDDVDGEGTSLTDFARDFFETALDRGLAHILVDYSGSAAGLTEEAERERGLRPVFLNIRPDRVIGWRKRIGESGGHQLDRVRYTGTRIEPDGPWGEEIIQTVRVIDFSPSGGASQLWTKRTDQGEFVLDAESGQRRHTFKGVPMVTMYADRTGFMTGKPPLEPLAWLNLCHYQSSSDQRNILHFARVPMLAETGVTPEQTEDGFVRTIAASSRLASTDTNAKFYWVEITSGAGIEAGNADIQRMEDQMEVLGLQPLIRRTGTTTATERQSHDASEECQLQMLVRRCEAAIRRAFVIAGQWIGVKVPDEFRVNIFNEFGISARAGLDIDALLKARMGGELSRETFLREIRRRSVISEDTDIEEEMGRIEAEGPDLAAIQPVPGFGDTEGTGEDTEDDGDETEEQQNAA